MRKIVGMILCCLSLNLFAATAYMVSSTQTNLYTQPVVSNKNVVSLFQGTPVTMLNSNVKNGFVQVRTAANTTGWVKADTVKQATPASSENKIERFFHSFGHEDTGAVTSQSAVMSAAQGPQTVATLETQVQALNAQVQQLQQHQHSDLFWFIWGVIAVLIGILIGKFTRRKKRSKSIFS